MTIGNHRPAGLAAIAADIRRYQRQFAGGVVPTNRRHLACREVLFQARIGDRPLAAEHADHTDFLDQFAQHETRIFLHGGCGVLAEIRVFGRDEHLHYTQHDDQAQRQGDQQFDEAKAFAAAAHGVITGSTVARLVRTKLRRESAMLAARESYHSMVIVYTR
ncbi:hypothetical protein D3C81_1279840 [compost metagenome]